MIRWIAVAAGVWLLLSFLLFMLSAQVEHGISSSAKDALSSHGTLLGGSNILVGKAIDAGRIALAGGA